MNEALFSKTPSPKVSIASKPARDKHGGLSGTFHDQLTTEGRRHSMHEEFRESARGSLGCWSLREILGLPTVLQYEVGSLPMWSNYM